MSVADITHTKWEFHSLSSIIELIGGGTPKTSIPEYWNGDIPWLSVNDFAGDSRYVSSTEKHITQAGLDNSSAKLLRKGDIIISARGTVGELAQLSAPMTFNQSCYGIRGISTKIDQAFLYYLLRTVVNDLRKSAHGSVFSTITRSTFESIEVPLPPLINQNRIAKVLGSLDDKIAANQRTIQSADSLRNALWDKLLKTNTESLPLSSLAEFINGRAFTKNATGTGRVVARIAELNSGIGSNTVFNDIEVHQNHVVLPGELLFAWSGTLMTKRWPYDEAIVNQHIFKVLPISKFDLWALELIIQSQIHYFQMIAAGKATTMGHIKRADLDKTVEVPTSIPDKLNMLGNTLWMLASQAEQENQTLARTRDELLPLLMSGKITVQDAEEASAEVGVDKHEVEE